ncbi:MAG: SdrD B-like domain-containing protein [candidate division WOR-3 bacterium]
MKHFFSFLVLLLSITIFTESYYNISVDNYLYSNSEYYSPYINVRYFSDDENSKNDFYIQLYRYFPSNLYFSTLNFFDRKNGFLMFEAGDISPYRFLYFDFRGFRFSSRFKFTGVEFLIGKENNFLSSGNNNLNRILAGAMLPLSITKNDTTKFFIFSREDKSFYSPFISQNIFGVNQYLKLFDRLNFDVTLKNHINHTVQDSTHSNLSYSIKTYLSTKYFSTSLSFQNDPEKFSDFSMFYRENKRTYLNFFQSIRILNFTSLFLNYTKYNINTSDNSSYERFGIKNSLSLLFLPKIDISYDIYRNLSQKNPFGQVLALNISRWYRNFYFNSNVSKNDFVNYKNLTFYSNISYNFYNGTNIGSTFKLTKRDSINDYFLTNYIRWKLEKIFSFEYGVDFGNIDRISYLGNHFNFSIDYKNYNFSNKLNIRYFERVQFEIQTKLNVTGVLDNIYTGILNGRVFYDKNNNEIFDGDDKPINNLTIVLNDSIVSKSNHNGFYTFKFLKPGRYKISIDKKKLPAYFDIKEYYFVQVENFTKKNVDIPLIKLGSISGYVFIDLNKDGVKDENEAGVAGVIVKIKDSDRYTYTDINGFYTISNLPMGAYIVEVPQLPRGYQFVFPNLIMYINVDKLKSDFTVDFGITEESKPVKKKVF